MKNKLWILVGVFSTLIGFYPLMFLFFKDNYGLLTLKPSALLSDNLWNLAFYLHIFLGGLALLIGWLQFNQKLRTKNLKLHRIIGKTYMIAVLISGFTSLYIACFATGGIVSKIGFFTMGVIWLVSTFLGYKAIKNGKVLLHQKFMIYSYACCFAAVTLRIWMPILIVFTKEFIPAYRIVAWLSWVPNLIVAYFMVRKIEKSN